MLPSKIQQILKIHFGKNCQLKKTISLAGGMVDTVLLITTSNPNEKFVLKISEKPRSGFEWQYKALDTLKNKYHFPVPTPYFFSNYNSNLGCSYLGMEYWNAVNMGMAFFTRDNRKIFEREIAEEIAKLHSYTDTKYYALFSEKKYDKLYQIMTEKFKNNMTDEVRIRIGEKSYEDAEYIIANLSKIFLDNEKPVLVHGDIWSTNVMLERKKGIYHLKGFVDPSPHFINREYELAYLEVFGMFSNELFTHYQKFHKIDKNFLVRRFFYHLLTMLIHVRVFGDLPYILRSKNLIKTCKQIINSL